MSELVNTNCPHCGAGIQVNPETKDQLVCRYCGSSFMIRDVIHNHTTINNYNDISQSTYDGIMGKRKVFLEEIKKEMDYFLKKESVYKEYLNLNNNVLNNIPFETKNNIQKNTNLRIWGFLLTTVGYFLAILLFLVNIRIGAIFLFLIGCGGVFMLVLYNRKKKIIITDSNNKEIHIKAQIKELKDELMEYYNGYGDCFVGFEYTYPNKITQIYDLIQSGRAESVKDAIQIMETP